jgi:hypothetical protein
MPKVSQEDMCAARVVHEDDDFITLEVAKRDDVSFHVAPLTEDDDSPPQQFYILMFFNLKEGRVWKPWEEKDEEPDG